jgi:hypothetical protein
MTMRRLFVEGTAYDDQWPDGFKKWKAERSARRENLAGAKAVAVVPENGAIAVYPIPK